MVCDEVCRATKNARDSGMVTSSEPATTDLDNSTIMLNGGQTTGQTGRKLPRSAQSSSPSLHTSEAETEREATEWEGRRVDPELPSRLSYLHPVLGNFPFHPAIVHTKCQKHDHTGPAWKSHAISSEIRCKPDASQHPKCHIHNYFWRLKIDARCPPVYVRETGNSE
jgi:hypothetical protein